MKSILSVLSALVLVSYSSVSLAQDAARGKELYATCIQCHGERGEGNVKEKGPKLSGQFDWYVITQITDVKNGKRKNPEMLPFVKGLTEQDIKDLAAYILTL